LSSQDFDEAPAERIELVRVRDVTMQADALKLRENINEFDATVEAVAQRDVYVAVLTRERYSGFASSLGKRIKCGPPAAT
jgi:hypothetical protein